MSSIPFRKPVFNNSVPPVTWIDDEIKIMSISKNLQYVVIGKFSYGWPNLDELRKTLSKQCNINEECQISLLRYRHILIRFELYEDFVTMMSKPSYHIVDKTRVYHLMMPLIYDEKFTVNE